MEEEVGGTRGATRGGRVAQRAFGEEARKQGSRRCICRVRAWGRRFRVRDEARAVSPPRSHFPASPPVFALDHPSHGRCYQHGTRRPRGRGRRRRGLQHAHRRGGARHPRERSPPALPGDRALQLGLPQGLRHPHGTMLLRVFDRPRGPGSAGRGRVRRSGPAKACARSLPLSARDPRSCPSQIYYEESGNPAGKPVVCEGCAIADAGCAVRRVAQPTSPRASPSFVAARRRRCSSTAAPAAAPRPRTASCSTRRCIASSSSTSAAAARAPRCAFSSSFLRASAPSSCL